MANFSVEQNRSFFPTDEITYYVENNDNRRSKACKLRFSVFCAPHVLNVFNRTSHRVCTECPNNANCSTNGLYAPIPNRGNWMSTNGVVLSCVSEKACPGTSDEMCGVGYTGIRCGDCSQGFYKLNKECLPCRGDYTIIIIILTGVLVGGAIVVSIVIRFAENGPSLGFAITFINFIQMISIVRELNLKWTQDFHTTVNGVSFFMFNPELLSPECFFPVQSNSYSLKFRLILAIPLALVALLLFFAACNSRLVRVPLCMAKAALSWCVGRGFTPPDAVSLQRRQNEMYFALWRGFNTALSFIYLIVASQSLSFFDCTEEGDGHHYLDSDPSLRCYEPWWQENLILAWLGVSLYVIGIPLYFFAIFYFFYQEKHRAAFFLRLKKICKEAISQNVYVKPEYQFLIFVQILLKFMVISIQQFFTRYAALQVLLMLFVCFISYVFYYGHTPYSYRSLNSLESLSSVSSAGILAIGLLLFTEQFRSEEQKFYLTATLLTIMATFVAATMAAVAYEFAVSYKSKSVKGGKQPKRKVLVLAASRVQLIGQDV
ncbi:hypothetical protein BKA69DRAFT_79178 [Paraphysoderma sedebokerense]|nr:hypothetical protein BKA69DRAFT_79178 [Paraphysoderma sedebokerense]